LKDAFIFQKTILQINNIFFASLHAFDFR